MTNPDELLTSALHAISDLPGGHGTRWQLTPATITVAGNVRVEGIFDGDGILGNVATSVALTSLIGYLTVDARVMVLVIPPAGNYVIADLSGAESSQDIVLAAGTTSSVGYTTALAGGGTPGVSFVAPASGRVVIHNFSALVNSGAFHTICSPYVRSGATVGAGTDVLSPADDTATYHVGTSQSRQGTSHLLGGLTPGAAYNAVQAFRVTGGTGTFGNQTLIVVPDSR